MSTIQATLQLYGEVGRTTLHRLPNGLWAVVALVAAWVALHLIAPLLAPLGFLGSLVYGLLHAGAVGWYLALLEIQIAGSRGVAPADLIDRLGTYLWEVISVLFVFWIGSMLLAPLGPLLLVAVVVASLVFSPVPEMIYQDRAQSLPLLGAAARFMQRNWPEWLLAHVPVVVVMSLLWCGLTPGSALQTALRVAQMFGPFFGFLDAAGGYALAAGAASTRLDVGLVVVATVSLLIVHAFLVFRGLLYKRLRGSSRRSRAWASRM